MKNNPPQKLTQKEIALLAGTYCDENAIKGKINVPVNFSTVEAQFDKLIKKEDTNAKEV